MRAYRFRLRPLSGWASPWRADTLFGALCWKYRFLAGEKALLQWLQSFRDGDPIFVLSDPFPGEYLPLPLGLAPKAQTLKKLKPPLLIPEKMFRQVTVSPSNEVEGVVPLAQFIRPADRLQASIGRISGTAERDSGGALFEVAQESFTEAAPSYFSLYVQCGEALTALKECLRMLSYQGYGKKCSIGLGGFNVEGEPEHCPWLDNLPIANGFVSLSHFVPRRTDPTDGSWRLHVTYPKFHGNEIKAPFKGSLLTLAPGSRFRTVTRPAAWYGSILPIPRPGFEHAVHYALCFAAPMVFPND